MLPRIAGAMGTAFVADAPVTETQPRRANSDGQQANLATLAEGAL
jgi:hypothetical protein